MKASAHQYEDKLLEYAYGELTPSDAGAVESHLRSCPRCTQALDEIRAVRLTMGKLSPEPVPAAGLESLFAYAEQTARRNAVGPAPVMSRLRKFLAPLVAVSALGVVTVVVVTQKNEPMTAEKMLAEEKVKDSNDRRAKREESAAQAPSVPEANQPVVAAKLEAKKTLNAFGANNEPAAGSKGDLSGSNAPSEQGQFEERMLAKEKAGERLEQEKVASKKPAPAKNAKGSAEVDGLARSADYSNSGVGAYRERAPRDEGKAKDNRADGYGMKQQAAPPPAAEAPQRAAVNKTEEAAPAQPQSLGLGLSSGWGGSGLGSLGGTDSATAGPAPASPKAPAGLRKSVSADDEQYAKDFESVADKKRADLDEQKTRVATSKEIAKFLHEASNAGSGGDRQGEARLALEALQRGAQGAQRLEALQRACEAFESLGEDGAADPYCDALLREFPTSGSAKALAVRRNRMQKAPTTKALSKPVEESFENPVRKAPTQAPASSTSH